MFLFFYFSNSLGLSSEILNSRERAMKLSFILIIEKEVCSILNDSVIVKYKFAFSSLFVKICGETLLMNYSLAIPIPTLYFLLWDGRCQYALANAFDFVGTHSLSYTNILSILAGHRLPVARQNWCPYKTLPNLNFPPLIQNLPIVLLVIYFHSD